MKKHLLQVVRLLPFRTYAVLFILLMVVAGCRKIPDHLPKLHLTTVATGLHGPMGIEMDQNDNIWVSEAGTANNDAKVVVITPSGEKYDAIIHLSSFINPHSGEIQGAGHMLLDNNILYVLSGNYLYAFDLAGFTPGGSPIDAANAQYEDVGAFVLNYPFVNNAHDTHPYNLTKGPDGDLYIADAGANAIIHRMGAGKFGVLAEVPSIPNPYPIGEPEVQSVPTAILYENGAFLVTTLTGFPFPSGQARIYKISMAGDVSIFQGGLTLLMDITKGNHFGHLAMEYGAFGIKGFKPNVGKLVWVNGNSQRTLTDGLNMPVAIKQYNPYTWYITSLGDGTVIKAAYF